MALVLKMGISVKLDVHKVERLSRMDGWQGASCRFFSSECVVRRGVCFEDCFRCHQIILVFLGSDTFCQWMMAVLASKYLIKSLSQNFVFGYTGKQTMQLIFRYSSELTILRSALLLNNNQTI